MSTINKQELRYVISAVIFSVVWFFVVIPVLLERGVEGSSPYIQFLIFNVGIFIFLQIFLKARTLRRGINIRPTLGIIALVMAIDTLIPPFLVTRSGDLLNSVVLKASGTDYIFGFFAINTIGLSGIMVFIFAYIIMPAVLLLLAAHLLPNLVREL